MPIGFAKAILDFGVAECKRCKSWKLKHQICYLEDDMKGFLAIYSELGTGSCLLPGGKQDDFEICSGIWNFAL